jgi:tripartite-type tricarboxylate transporter receptor subunit TctC
MRRAPSAIIRQRRSPAGASAPRRRSLFPEKEQMRRVLLRSLAALAAAAALAPAGASAQTWPDRPIKLIVPFAPGGTTDIVARLVADKLGTQLGKPVVVENRAGAGGALGSEALAKAAPDGYTIGMATQSTHAANPALQPKLGYDALKDFAPVSMLAIVPGVLAVHPSVPAKTMKEFIALAKAQPGKLSYGTPGIGSLGHLLMAQFEDFNQVDLLHVPYKGSGQALNDVLAGQIQVIGDNLPSALPHIQAGKLRALGVQSYRRVPSLPDVPTYAEMGMGDIGKPAWFGIAAPANTPAPVVAKLNEAIRAALKDPQVVAKLAQSGSEPAPGTPEEFARAIRETMDGFRAVVKSRNIKPE